ncbi:ATP-binding protein [Blautia coccoides]|uniref:ATP-binding protein n=2 Tax=Blautia producta TaxID=33035 RepID=A0A7G5MVS6_9FIRM|nr:MULTISPECIES: ATP-binding protein [Blautia]MCR1990110.1 ATP-binding protein [Blautia coccoides]MDU5208000.1 ATP-binding protein [Clostridioides difficile]QIB54202.1 sensor histidine kinase [Blautia producta ATCC 27340 = DSM 2950]QMW78719.1 ATP-binding protein [Blautia producta]
MKYLYNILQFILSYIEVYLAYRINGSIAKEDKKKGFIWEQLFSVGLAFAISINRNIRLFSIMILLFMIVCITLSSKMIYKNNIGISALVTATYILGVTLVDLFVVFSIGLILKQQDFGTQIGRELSAERIIVMAITRGIIVVICLLIDKIRNGFPNYNKTKYALSSIVIIEIISISIFHKVYAYDIVGNLAGYWFMWITVATIIAALFFTYVMYRNNKEAEKITLQRMKLLEYNYQNMITHYKQSEHVFHDFKNHLFVISELITENEIKQALQYIYNIAEPFQLISKDIWSERKIIDLVLNYKIYECMNQNIKMDLDIDNISNPLSIKDSELCALFSNLLDNAIEACQKIGSIEKRWIKVSVKQRNSMLFIKVENSIIIRPIEKEKRLITIKKDKEKHGIGFDSIKDIVIRYNGKIDYIYTNSTFLVDIVIGC